MDCSAFRRHHVAYVDDTLPGDLLVAAARHLAECPACARHDTAVRRSLLLVRNVPTLQCSADFAARLEARLDAVRAERAGGPEVAGQDWAPSWWELQSARLRGRPAAVAAAALLAVAGGASLRPEQPHREVAGIVAARMVPFVRPFSPPSPTWVAVEEPVFEPASGVPLTWVAYHGGAGGVVDAASLVVPAATGAPVWPAAMLAGEAPEALWREVGGSAGVEDPSAGPAGAPGVLFVSATAGR